MSATILQRVFALADAPPNDAVCAALSTIARKLASGDEPATIANTITSVLRKLEPAEQERVVAAAEALRKA